MQDAFFASVGRDYKRFRYANILYVIAQGNYATIVENTGKQTLVNHTLIWWI